MARGRGRFRCVPHRPQRAGLQHHHRDGHDVPGSAGDAGLARRAGGVRGGRSAGSREALLVPRGGDPPRSGRSGVRGDRVPPGGGAVSQAEKAAPVKEVLAFLGRAYPDARVLLAFRNPFELLVATVLAAQCTDDRVNRVTPALFRAYPGPASFANASRGDLEEAVRPTGFFRNKAKAVRGLSEAIVTRHGRHVPGTMEELTALPGVGRKTASILLGASFGIPALPVDTHVARVSFRLGLTRSKDPRRIEEDLAKTIPRGNWWEFATRLGWHG